MPLDGAFGLRSYRGSSARAHVEFATRVRNHGVSAVHSPLRAVRTPDVGTNRRLCPLSNVARLQPRAGTTSESVTDQSYGPLARMRINQTHFGQQGQAITFGPSIRYATPARTHRRPPLILPVRLQYSHADTKPRVQSGLSNSDFGPRGTMGILASA